MNTPPEVILLLKRINWFLGRAFYNDPEGFQLNIGFFILIWWYEIESLGIYYSTPDRYPVTIYGPDWYWWNSFPVSGLKQRGFS